jgi:hypothetical protein
MVFQLSRPQDRSSISFRRMRELKRFCFPIGLKVKEPSTQVQKKAVAPKFAVTVRARLGRAKRNA